MAHTLISCDDHLDLGQLPPDLWTTRLPATLRDRAPFVSERNGQPLWICDGKVWGAWAGKAAGSVGTATAEAAVQRARPRRHHRSQRTPAGARGFAPSGHGP